MKVVIGIDCVYCPFCNKWVDAENSLQYDDYIIEPMLWCDSCGARAVLNFHGKANFNRNDE